MNLSEFKAWFEGFTESISGLPNKKQWARIQDRVAEITSDPTPWPIFVERYYRPYSPWWNTTTLSLVSITSAPNQITSNACFAHVGRAEQLSLTNDSYVA